MIKTGKKKLYSVDDLTKILPITPLTIRNYIKAGKIKGGYKIGKSWYVTKENLEAFLDGPGQEGEGIAKSKVET